MGPKSCSRSSKRLRPVESLSNARSVLLPHDTYNSGGCPLCLLFAALSLSKHPLHCLSVRPCRVQFLLTLDRQPLAPLHRPNGESWMDTESASVKRRHERKLQSKYAVSARSQLAKVLQSPAAQPSDQQ